MFCTQCGASCKDDAQFCTNCGNSLQAAPQAPQQPVYQQPVYQQPVYQQPVYQQPVYQQPVRQPVTYNAPRLNVAGALKKNTGIVALLVAALALVMFVVSTFSLLDLPVSLSVSGSGMDDAYEMVEEYTNIELDVNTASVYLSTGEFADLCELADDYGADIDVSATPLYIGNILYGLINLVIAVACVLYFMKKRSNAPYYDDFVGRYLKVENPLFLVCGAGVVGGLIQALLFLLAGTSESEMGVKATLTVGVPWLTWLAVGVFAVVCVADMILQSKETE